MKIQYTVTHYHSKTDVNGNRYWGARVCRTRDGKSVVFTTPAPSNLNFAMKLLTGNEWGHFTEVTVEMPIREFNSFTKTWPYFGCASEDIAKKIKVAYSQKSKEKSND